MKDKDRIVISGIGVIAPNGIGKDAYWDAIKNGKSGVGLISLFDPTEHKTRIAGEVKDFDPEEYMDKKMARRMSRFSQFALAAAKMAKEDAKLEITECLSEEIGVAVGVGLNGIEIIEKEEDVLQEKGPEKINPFSSYAVSANSAAASISVELGIRGMTTTIATGCSAGLNAIGLAYENIKYGKCKMMLAGGTEASISPLAVASFGATRTLSERNEEPEKASRPYEKNRDGFILGEGACIIVLESLASALDRNANIYSEIMSYTSTTDAYSAFKVEPSGRQAARAMYQALNDAKLKPKDISHINAHGSSSQVADIRETNAIKMAFDDYAYKIPVGSIKSMIGHPFAAAGSLQLAASVMGMQDELVSPTINYDKPDPDCDLDYIPNEARSQKVRYDMINTLGMGGNNASMVLGNIAN